MFTKFLKLPVFIIGFVIGMVFVTLSSPEHNTIFVYPTPDNIHHLEYKDKADNCFAYDVKKVNCPKKHDDIKNIPVQMGTTKQKLPAKKLTIGNTEINKI